MENKINRVIKLLAIAEDDKDKSVSIFDGNDNTLCSKGTPKVTASESAAIRQYITSSLRNDVLLKVSETDYLCVKVSNIVIGKGNFNKDTRNLGCDLKGDIDGSNSSQNNSHSDVKKVPADAKSEKKKSCEMLSRKSVLTAMCVEDFTIILIGHKLAVAEDPLLKQIKDVAKILANINSLEAAS